MKEGIHPAYSDTKVVCSTCNNTFTTGSTYGKELRLDICSNCHPFYTGSQNMVVTSGNVDKFKNKYRNKYRDDKASAGDAA